MVGWLVISSGVHVVLRSRVYTSYLRCDDVIVSHVRDMATRARRCAVGRFPRAKTAGESRRVRPRNARASPSPRVVCPSTVNRQNRRRRLSRRRASALIGACVAIVTRFFYDRRDLAYRDRASLGRREIRRSFACTIIRVTCVYVYIYIIRNAVVGLCRARSTD